MDRVHARDRGDLVYGSDALEAVVKEVLNGCEPVGGRPRAGVRVLCRRQELRREVGEPDRSVTTRPEEVVDDAARDATDRWEAMQEGKSAQYRSGFEESGGVVGDLEHQADCPRGTPRGPSAPRPVASR
jgi:hypothetical protein